MEESIVTSIEETVLWHLPQEGFSDRFRVTMLGIQHRMPPEIVDRPQGTGDHLFMLFHDSVPARMVDGTSLRPPNTLVVWGPSDGHFYGDPERPWVHSWFHCEGDAVSLALSEAGIPLNREIGLGEPDRFDWYLQAMRRELVSRTVPVGRIVENDVHNLILEIGCVVGGEGDRVWIPEEYRDLREYMEREYHRPLTIRDLARRVHVSIPHFCRRFRALFGVPPIEYVLRLRMQHAAYLLRDQSLRVGEIAQRVGCQDVHYFSRSFGKRFGLSPSDMRQRYIRRATSC
jgi:AraC family transcriptional regulator, arabinose operon regulatory protein